MSGNLLGSQTTSQIQLLNGQVPREGPRAVPLQLDFTATTTAEVDFTLGSAQSRISGVQAVWIDNTENSDDLVIVAQVTGQRLVIPANSQGSFPVIGAIPPKFALSTGGGVIIESLWLNVPIPANEWQASVSAVPSAPTNTAVATGGTAVPVFATMPVNGGYVTNPYSAAESLFIDPINNADTVAPGAHGTTSELTAGQSYFVAPGTSGSLSANAVTNGHTFTAVAFQ
jgi:hypothetical protein